MFTCTFCTYILKKYSLLKIYFCFSYLHNITNLYPFVIILLYCCCSDINVSYLLSNFQSVRFSWVLSRVSIVHASGMRLILTEQCILSPSHSPTSSQRWPWCLSTPSRCPLWRSTTHRWTTRLWRCWWQTTATPWSCWRWAAAPTSRQQVCEGATALPQSASGETLISESDSWVTIYIESVIL